MSFRHDMRRLELIPFELGATKSISIPRDRLIKGINLNFHADLVVADPGAGVAGTVNVDSVLGLISRIEIVADGAAVLYRSDGRGAYWRNAWMYGTPAILTVPGAGAAATYPIETNIQIDFGNTISRVPSDTYLNAAAYKSLELFVTWNSSFAAAGSVFSATHTMTDSIASTFGIRPVVFETSQPLPSAIRIQDYLTKTISATQADFEVDLSVGNRLYQMFSFMTKDAQVRESDIINAVDLRTADKFYHVSLFPDRQLHNWAKLLTGLETVPAGFYILPLLEDGLLTSGLNVSDVNTCKLIFDVTVGTGTTLLQVYQDYIVAIPK